MSELLYNAQDEITQEKQKIIEKGILLAPITALSASEFKLAHDLSVTVKDPAEQQTPGNHDQNINTGGPALVLAFACATAMVGLCLGKLVSDNYKKLKKLTVKEQNAQLLSSYNDPEI